MSVHLVQILEAASKELVEVELHDDLPADALLDVEDQWADARTRLRVRLGAAGVARLPADMGKPVVYVDYVESAPWNWTVEQVGQKSRHRAVGPVLLRAAVEQSYAEGREGRVGFHALSRAEGFYQDLGFARVAYDAHKQGLPYYELTAAGAGCLRKG